VLKITEAAARPRRRCRACVLGANPRKGHSHTEEDVASELCDVVPTAVVALSTLTPDAQAVFRRHLDRVAGRYAVGGSTVEERPSGAGRAVAD
jgi:hypothetical protein